MRSQGIKADAHFLAFAAVHVVRTQDAVGDGVFTGLVSGDGLGLGGDFRTIEEVNSMIDYFYHNYLI